ncbi:MAG TPA: CXXX repeat peptide modification system protein [Ignavibacteria bacterium]
MTTKNKGLVGKVTSQERNEIKDLFERKNGLIELTKSLADSNQKSFSEGPLYNKLVKDMSVTSTRFQLWWDGMGKKYKWKGKEGYSWRIDFETCEIFLTKD